MVKENPSLENIGKVVLRILKEMIMVGMIWELRIPGFITKCQHNRKYVLILSIYFR